MPSALPTTTPSRARVRAAVAEPLPFVRADLTAADPATQVAFWQGVAPGAYAVRADPRPTTPLNVTTTVRRVDDLMLTRFKARAHVVARQQEQVGRGSAPYLKLRLYLRGGTRLVQGDGTTLHRLGPGAVHLIDQSRPWIAEHGDHEQLSLFATHAAVGYDPSRFAACESLPLDQPLGRMLADVLRAFARRADEVSVADAPALARGLTGAVRGLLEGGGSSEAEVDIRTARRAAMRRYIEAHLGDPELGIERLCGAFGAARATIYRDFACEGGVERYIVQRRLTRAFEFLSHHPGKRGVVRAVAERCGFSSTSHFSHAFTQRFGMRPAHAVGLAAAPGPVAAAPEPPLPVDLEALRARLAALYASFTGG